MLLVLVRDQLRKARALLTINLVEVVKIIGN